MRIIFITTLCLILFSCSGQADKLIKKTGTNLKSTKSVSYHVDNLTIHGQSVGDTIFTATYALFEKSETDTLLGYNFFIESSLIHPWFLIPMVYRDHYNGMEHTWTLESEVRNDRIITEFSEIENSALENKVSGHLPMLLNLLHNNQYKKTSIAETTLNGKDCIQINFLCNDSIDYNLFVYKNEKTPTLLRIIFNKEQPFIQEYYYRDFNFSNTTPFPLILEFSEDDFIELPSIKIGDYFPGWMLETISGAPLHFGEQKGKAHLIFLSGINCGACQLQIPTTKRIYEQFSQRKDLNIIGLYPYDSKERLNIYAEEKEIEYPIIYNSLISVEDRYALIQKLRFPIPTMILIGKDNKVAWMKTGFNPDYTDEYFYEVEKQIKKVSP
jgi:hypothetical protein